MDNIDSLEIITIITVTVLSLFIQYNFCINMYSSREIKELNQHVK